eukprot:CAMPEP_0184350862 /NCGR_PEP_ID=MMETSP1089-20130417/42729_1 /TAXON_ID=38269 ORGANISM="Gloeochaete wittrockiana, Strain SAG46.84" /NCGR_SAMPLE_ID=MMETSP1089 /ASSEMBLY_ACC=CAM_ASM_000445 /LENGTH=415 /DNA_ID=CAMNT_0026683951 /DNA_START=418 /DNA_END=1666 /DNA_ORIENTATION=-
MYGGFGSTSPTLWTVDTATNLTWRAASSVGPGVRFGHALVGLPVQNALVLYGGMSSGGSMYTDMWLYAPLTSTWCRVVTSGDQLPYSTYASTALRSNLLYVFGGHDVSLSYRNDLYQLDISNQCRATVKLIRPVGIKPPPRIMAAMASNGRSFYLFYGQDRVNLRSDVWRGSLSASLDAVQWTQLTMSNNIIGRTSIGITTIPWASGLRFVLYGGATDSDVSSQTALFDPNASQFQLTGSFLLLDASGPFKFASPSLTYDGANVYLTGGGEFSEAKSWYRFVSLLDMSSPSSLTQTGGSKCGDYYCQSNSQCCGPANALIGVTGCCSGNNCCNAGGQNMCMNGAVADAAEVQLPTVLAVTPRQHNAVEAYVVPGAAVAMVVASRTPCSTTKSWYVVCIYDMLHSIPGSWVGGRRA